MLNYASRWSAVGCTNSTTQKWLDTAGLLMEVADDPDRAWHISGSPAWPLPIGPAPRLDETACRTNAGTDY